MAFCSHCGQEIGSDDAICSSCGTNRSAAGWALAVEICSCDEPTARGWRYCVNCGEPTAVVAHGRTVHVSSEQVQSWFEDLLPVADHPAQETAPEAPAGPETETSDGTGAAPRPVGRRRDIDLPVVPTAPDARSGPEPQAPPTRRPAYTSAVLAAGTAQRVLLSTALTTLIAAATLWVLNSRLEEFKQGSTDTFDSALSVANLADWGTRPLVVVGVTASAWYVMRWTVIVYGNILSFGRTRLRLPPSAVPWAFFVPVLNFFAPRRLINDAWRAPDEGHHGGQDWMLQRGNVWTGAAWLAGVSALALHITGWRIGDRSVDAAIASNRLAMLGYLATGAAAVGAVMMTQRITERQERRNAEIDAMAVDQEMS